MVLKVSISLPGDAVITLEASEPQVFQEVVALALRELPKTLMRPWDAATTPTEITPQGKDVTATTRRTHGKGAAEDGPGHSRAPGQTRWDERGVESFGRFCKELSPLGDMRRVVVACEGAQRSLGMASVSVKELAALFELAGWRQPANFLQTLRNAARSKFRWLERVPGTTGHYSVTQAGRDEVLAGG